MTSIVKGVEVDERFTVTTLLGKGTYGSVFKGYDCLNKRVVAIKELVVEDSNEKDGTTQLAKELEMELKILEECACKHIVAYYGSFLRDDGKLWIVMEYMSAGSILDLMAICEYRLTESECSIVLRHCLKGIVKLHKRKIIHRDIKAGNILINGKGECKLADFGVSAELQEKNAKRQTQIGSPFWMAPEVIKAQPYGPSADIWSIGVTAIEMVTGDPPRSHLHPMVALFKIPRLPPPALPEGAFSAEFRNFLSKCLVKDPEQRSTAKELLQHPFIKNNSTSKKVLAQLVRDEIDKIEEYRNRSDSDDESDDEKDDNEIRTMLISTYKDKKEKAKKTMKDKKEPEIDTGTMIWTGNDEESATMVWNNGGNESGTMIVNNDDDEPDYGDDDGMSTMIFSPKNKTKIVQDEYSTMIQKPKKVQDPNTGKNFFSKYIKQMSVGNIEEGKEKEDTKPKKKKKKKKKPKPPSKDKPKPPKLSDSVPGSPSSTNSNPTFYQYSGRVSQIKDRVIKVHISGIQHMQTVCLLSSKVKSIGGIKDFIKERAQKKGIKEVQNIKFSKMIIVSTGESKKVYKDDQPIEDLMNETKDEMVEVRLKKRKRKRGKGKKK